MSVPYNGGPPKASNWVGMGAGLGVNSGWWSDRAPEPWQASPAATVATGLNNLFFMTKEDQVTGFVSANSHTSINLLSFTGQHRNILNQIHFQ